MEKLRICIALFMYPLLLFIPAGTWKWPWAWVVLFILYTFLILMRLGPFKTDPNLYKERLGSLFQKEQKLWDKFFMGAFSICYVLWYPLMGTAARSDQLADPFKLWIHILGLAGMLFGLVVIYFVFKANTFASPVVKIHTDRDHTVVNTGPYKYVRHPMYSAVIVLFPSIAMTIGSVYGLKYSGLLVMMILIRTYLEDHTLQKELPGYLDYCHEVNDLLIPKVW